MGKLIPRGVFEAALATCVGLSVAGGAGCTSAERPVEDAEDTGVATSRLTADGGPPGTCIVVTGAQVADTQIGLGEGSGANQNYGTSTTANAGEVGGYARQALFSFNLSAVPTGAVVLSASVTLTESNNAAATVRVHDITAAWSQNTVTWTSFGEAYAPAVASSFSNGGPSFNGPVTFDVTALAQGWVNTPSQNFGFLLEQDPVGDTRFWTTRDANVSQQPSLGLCYAAQPPATQMVNAGQTSQSPHYSTVYTLGQPSMNQGASTSPSYRVQGGLVGANGSLP